MLDLETTWFLLIGVLLAGYAILDGFDLGVGILYLKLARDDRDRRTLLGSIAPVWDGNEVWLLTAGGAIFAAFPPVYATVFSGFYTALMLLLAGLILRAVALEFRSHEPGSLWRGSWDVAFAAGSFLPALLVGVAVGNVMRGLPLDEDGEFAGTFVGLLNPFALAVGLLTVALFTMHGAAWLLLKTEGNLQSRARRALGRAWWSVVLLWALATTLSAFVAPHLWRIYARPWAWLVPTLCTAAVLTVRFALERRREALVFSASSILIAALIGIMGQGLYPSLVPALGGAPGLTVHNAASSPLTLRTMLVIALMGMPLVVTYTVFIYRSLRGPVVLEEL
jgi:cytochrome d ubiquinol oxidase subunit II